MAGPLTPAAAPMSPRLVSRNPRVRKSSVAAVMIASRVRSPLVRRPVPVWREGGVATSIWDSMLAMGHKSSPISLTPGWTHA